MRHSSEQASQRCETDHVSLTAVQGVLIDHLHEHEPEGLSVTEPRRADRGLLCQCSIGPFDFGEIAADVILYGVGATPGVVIVAVVVEASSSVEAPGEVDMLHLTQMPNQSEYGKLDRRHGPAGQLGWRKITKLAKELVALIVEPRHQVLALIPAGFGFVSTREVDHL